MARGWRRGCRERSSLRWMGHGWPALRLPLERRRKRSRSPESTPDDPLLKGAEPRRIPPLSRRLQCGFRCAAFSGSTAPAASAAPAPSAIPGRLRWSPRTIRDARHPCRAFACTRYARADRWCARSAPTVTPSRPLNGGHPQPCRHNAQLRKVPLHAALGRIAALAA
jgi:hypothetical protein